MNKLDFDTYTKEQLICVLEQLAQEEYINEKIQSLLGDTNKVLEEYKARMEEMFFPPFGMPISNLKISDALVEEYYDKTKDPTLEFRMYYIEILVEFLQTFGLMGNSFFRRIIDMYKEICSSNQGKDFYDRLDHILQVMVYMDPSCQDELKETLNKLNI